MCSDLDFTYRESMESLQKYNEIENNFGVTVIRQNDCVKATRIIEGQYDKSRKIILFFSNKGFIQ